jgi:signal transduction histidine kinase
VNNFSEVSKELIVEVQEALAGGNYQLTKEILDDVEENLDKINHHGKRADSIIKGMLQHSRSSVGSKEATDINALADEYFRLAFHGLRARDKSFNAAMETDFDESMGKIGIIPQEIGRVVLNLITNAFYAVNARRKQAGIDYQPTVWLRTRRLNGRVEVEVTDNGNGIPEKDREKIFQPFFTTKPSGEGTGLGLSMSYDIVTKGHGGELKMESREGEGTTFTMVLPIETGSKK